MKARLIKTVIGWLWKRWPYLMKEVVIGHGHHCHANPKRKPKMVQEGGV